MKTLNFLIICFIILKITISTSIDGQRSTNRKETLSSSNKQRILAEDNYIYVQYSSEFTIYYVTGGSFKFNIPSRNGITWIKHSRYDGDMLKNNGYIEIETGVNLKIYFDHKVSNLKDFFNSGLDNRNPYISFVHFRNFDTSDLINMSGLFNGCSRLTSVDFGNFEGVNVTNIANMFSGCSSLTIVNLGSFIGSNVTSINAMFSGCTKLKTINLGKFVGSEVTGISAMFSRCTALESVNLGNFVGSGLIDISSMLSGCTKLKTVNLGSFVGSEVKNISLMFSECSTIESVNLVNFIGSKVTNISAMFSGCTSIKTVNLENFVGSEVTDISAMFSGCTKLKTVNLGSFVGSKVTDISALFSGYTSLESINLENFVGSEVTDISFMFSGCTSIKTINLGSFVGSKVTDISAMFSGCTSLESVNFTNFKATKVTNMNKMFYNCSSIKSLNLSSLLKTTIEVVTDFENILEGCVGLKILDLSGLTFPTTSSDILGVPSNLKYLDIKGSVLTEKIKKDFLDNIEELTVCQDKDLIMSDEYKYVCCDINEGIEACETESYIKIYFKKNEGNTFSFENFDINNIMFAISGEKGFPRDELTSETVFGSDLTIYFLSSLVTLESLFEGSKNIKSVDLTHLDFSLINSTEKMFKESSLIKIDLSNINAPYLTTMASMFENCLELLSVKLNNFTAKQLINMENILIKCEKLKVLEVYGLDFSSQSPESSLFGVFNELSYLNIKNVEFIDKIKQQFEKIILAKDKTIICQNEDLDIEKNEKNIYHCCDYNLEYNDCKSNLNFIKVSYEIKKSNEKIEYNEGFGKNREEIGIMSIIKVDTIYKINEALIIKKNEEIEIYFSKPVQSLKDMFNSNIDNNVVNISSIDFSYFNTSSLRNMNSLLKGCTGLKEIDFSSFDTSLVTDMSYLFYNCTSLTSINLFYFKTSNVTNMVSMFEGCNNLQVLKLQNFDTSLVTDMSKMFYFCKSLVFLDISNFNMQNVNKYDDMFTDVGANLKFLNLYNVEDLKEIIINSVLNTLNNLIVCQKDKIITNQNAFYYCCYFNFTTEKCEDDTTNLFRIIFASDAEYPNGFESEYRKNIKFIIGKDHNEKISPSTNISFIAGKTYEIYLILPIKKLDNYFNGEKDLNLKQIKLIDVILPNTFSVLSLESMFQECSSLESISLVYIDTSSVTTFNLMFRDCKSLKRLDLSHFNTKSAQEMKEMFRRCQSLGYIDVSSFNTALVTTMHYMFYECSSLEYLDLSYFDTSQVYDMTAMFFNCIKLKVLDISSFNMKKIDDQGKVKGMLNSLKSLKYINIYNVKNTEDYIKDSLLKNIENLTICQKEDIIINENAYYNCCYYDISTNKCESYNYMLIYYDQDVSYENGFSNNADTEFASFRKEDYFIINKNYTNIIDKENKLAISKGSKLEVYLKTSITSLENYFNVNNDPNAQYIKKVDLSHLDFSSIKSTSNMFYRCSNLQSVYFSDIEMTSLTDTNMMFYNCISLEYVELLYFNTSLVKNMGSMFEGCEKIEILDLSFFDTSSVNNMDKMFYGCKNLKYLDISTFNFESINKIEDIFYGTNNLYYLNLYNIKKYNGHLKNQELKSRENPIVCQKEKIITQDNVIEDCCYFNTNNTTCESSNFIVLYFEKETIYEKGFIGDNKGNKIREDEIDFIINGNHSIKYKGTDKLFIGKGKKIEIYFKPGITYLEYYFSVSIDPNMENVVSMDLSHFNTSSVKNMSSMFYGCYSLKSIDLYDIDTSSVEDMNNMFKDCSQLETLDLSFFDTSLVTNMDSIFNGCESLIYLDISNFNLEKIKNFKSVFTGVGNLLYINLYSVNNSYNNITESELNELEGITVCQKEYLVTNENATYNCCYYDTEKKECLNNNFAVIYFNKDTTYESGFKNEYRERTIDFIINRDHYYKLSDTEKFRVKKGHKIEVYFYSNVTSLYYYFSVDEDKNMENVCSMDLSNLKTSSIIDMRGMFSKSNSLKSIELSNIDTSKVTDMGYMFYECSSLEFIDLSYFDTSLVKTMENMFETCQSLKIIDLSYFITPSLTNMEAMFNECNSLQLLDISRFNLEALENEKSMFKNNNNLTYINLYYVQDSKGYITKSINYKESGIDINNLIVCQKGNIIDSIDKRCCYYNMENKECENNKYITIFFGDKTIYNKGFEDDFREGIDFIINGEEHNKKLSGKEILYLHRGSKLEIYYLSDSLSLQNYFSAAKDTNMKNLVSVYLSNLNATVSNNLDNLFYGCDSLKTVINLNDIKTLPIVNMSYMFYNCSSLEFIDLSIFDTSLVQNMISLFQNCKSLKYLDISHFNLGSLKDNNNIKNMFRDVDNLNYINVYNVQDPNKLLLNYNYQKKLFSKVPQLIVCQKEDNKVISHVNITNKCCYYEINSNSCNDNNFITIYYGNDVEYTSFENDCRLKGIDYIINGDSNTKLSSKDARLTIKKGSKLEIHFSYPLDSLEDYFSPSYDPNMKYLVSVDLSNFNTSILTNMKSTFADCEQLETVDLYNFKGASIINMNFLFSNCVSLKSIDFSYLYPFSVAYMNSMFSGCISLESIKFSSTEFTSLINLEEIFEGCSSLKSIDLSKFITTSVINMEYMFFGCTSLKYLDISNFNMKNVIYAVSMFENTESLKYINLYNAKDYNSYISQSELNNLKKLPVCQKEQILTKDDVINKCCKYNITTEQCDYTNYLEIYYGENAIYEYDFKNCSRKDIDYIIIGVNDKHFNDNEYLDIKQNTKVEIHFKNKLKSLFNFFCSEDENTENIVSIDLSHLDTSELEDISSMFSGCSSVNSINLLYFNTSSVINMSSLFEGCTQLESIDLSNFETSSVKDMSKMFYGCTQLTSIILSSFDTSSVNDMSYLFYGCSSIQSLDLSNFNTRKVTNFNSIFSGCINLKVLDISHFELGENSNTNKKMFNGVNNLRYINLSHAIDNTDKRHLNSSLSGIKNINVCQNVNKRIVKYESIIERCCYYNILTDKCENSNFIVVKYGKFEGKDIINYGKGFVYNSFNAEKVREGKIDFIIYKNKKYAPTDELNIEAGSEIEIYLINITILESFFNYYDIDENAIFIESVDFSNLDASNITNMNSIFNGCLNLISVDFSNFNSSSLITMNSMFYDCESIESIDLSNFKTSLVTDMSYLFDGCRDLKYIYLSNINTSKVENMSSMFSGCESLVSLDLSYFQTSSLTNIGYMFDSCKVLKVLDISYLNLDNITNHDNIFRNVDSLKYISLYYVEDEHKIIQNSEISNLNDLIVCQKEEKILPINIDNNREKRCCYFNITENMCESDNYIILNYGKESEYKNGFINKYRNGVSFIINGDYINTLSNNQSFKVNAGCKIEIYFNSILTSLESFFDYNYDINIGNIKSIDLSHFNSSLITDMSKAFSGCTSLESINFDNFIFSSVTNMNNMFFGCDSLKSIDLTLLDVSKVTDMSYMFYSCDSLKSINTTYFNISSVTKMNYMFYRCISLESIDFSFYTTSPLINLEKAFYGCKNLTSLNLSKFDTSLVTNMNKIFYGCDNLIYIDISNFNMEKCEYYSNAFSSKDKIIFINLFRVKYDKIASEEFRKTNNIIFICQSENIIKNQKAINCCEFNFEYNICENMPTTFVTSYIQESTFIKSQSTINMIFTDKTIFTEDKLMTTYISENNKIIDSTFTKEKTESLIKTTYIQEETEGFTDFRSAIFNEPTTFIAPDTKQVESSFYEERLQSTTNSFKDTSYIPEALFNTSKIETTLINIPTSNLIIETTSSIKETPKVTSEFSTQSISTNENVFPSTDINESTNILKESELKIISFTDIAKSIIKEITGEITKASSIVHTTSIPTEKKIQTTSLPEKTTALTTTSVENQQSTSNLYSTSKEEITEKTTKTEEKSTSQREEIKSSDLEKVPTSELNIDTKEFTSSKADITQTNIGTYGLITSNVDILEQTTNINVPTSFEENIVEPTTYKNNILETTNEKVDNKEINTSYISTTYEPKQQPSTLEPSRSLPKQEPTTSESSTSEPKQEPSTLEPFTSETITEPTTSEPMQEPSPSETIPESTSESKQEPSTSETITEPPTSQPKQEYTTSETITEPTSESKQEPSTSETIPEPTTSETMQEPSPSETITEPTTSESKQEPSTSETIPESTSESKQEPSTSEPTTSEPKPESSTSELKHEKTNSETMPESTSYGPKKENTTSEAIPEPPTSEPKKEPITSEIKNTQYSIATTSINKPKTETILTTILNHINHTSITSTEIKIPTTIIERKIKTTITEYGSAYVVLLSLSHFLKFISYFTFNVHFRSIRGFIFSQTLTMIVQLINNRLLRILQNHQANCEKINDNLENAVYLCTVVADVSNVNSIKVESDFNFESQDIKVIGITPVAQSLMENVQNATGEYDTLLQSNIYVLDHSSITANKINKTFNITGIIDDPKVNLSNIELILIINVEKEEDTLKEEVNCSIFNISVSNYTLNCLGEKNILYNLQSAVSFFDNDTLLVNFDENIPSEIIFDASSSYKFRNKNTNGLNAGAIVTIILVFVIVLATVVTLVFLRKKIFYRRTLSNSQDSAVVGLDII